MLSIVIPVFKEQEYLPRTLKSLTNQSIIKHCEIILAEYNPNSSSFTKDVAIEFSQKFKIPIRIRCVYKPGIAYARNEGVLESSGKYLINFDADARFNTKYALEKIVKALMDGARMTVCDNEFDYKDLTKEEMKDMMIPQQVLDSLNNTQVLGFPILEPGSAFDKDAFVDVGGFNDVRRWELSILGPRFILKYGKPKYLLGVSVIVSPRRAMKLRELGLGTLNYANAVRGDNVVEV